jgi:hypothetical protein
MKNPIKNYLIFLIKYTIPHRHWNSTNLACLHKGKAYPCFQGGAAVYMGPPSLSV